MLEGDRVSLRPVRADDAPVLARLGADPSVARWWPGIDEDTIRGYAASTGKEHSFAIELEGEVIGLAQFWEENDPDYRHAGIDLFLGAPFQDQGLGVDTVRTLAVHLFRDRGHHRVVIDPAADNVRAIRAYEKIGFKRVGTLRQYERSPDGGWRDGVLMDLLADELE
jgi:aminoglycoside 6'-N-acetyltransferase